jgi:hypothetical protein
MTPSRQSDNGWRVVLETRDRQSAPYTNVYGHVQAETRDGAIDVALERYTGMRAGQRALLDGWYVVAAWAVPEDVVGDVVTIEPIDQPVFRRRVAQ